MKTILLIRHGESEGNESPIYKNPDSPLTASGRNQSLRLAARLAKDGPYHALVSSTLLRAKQTADIIGEKLGLSPAVSDLFVERRKPSGHIGLEKTGPEMLAISKTIHDNFREGFRFSDEENFDDLKARSGRALMHLVAMPYERIVVATHGVFMRCMAAYATFGPVISGREMGEFMRAFRTDNGGIATLECDESRANPWTIRAWNDRAHFSDPALLFEDEDRL